MTIVRSVVKKLTYQVSLREIMFLCLVSFDITVEFRQYLMPKLHYPLPSDHVGGVDSPAINAVRCFEPVGYDGIRGSNHLIARLGIAVIQFREVPITEPMDITRLALCK